MNRKARSRVEGSDSTLTLALFLISLLLIAGCTVSAKQVQPSDAGRKIKKIAVLPFYNMSGQKDAGKIVANVFVTEMFKSGRFRVEEPGNIAQFMIQERSNTIGELEVEKIKILGKRLGVDAVVVGTVEEFDDGRGGAYPSPTVSMTVRMIDANNGQLIWAAQNKRRGDDYIIVFDLGEVRSATTLTQKLVKEMIDTIK